MRDDYGSDSIRCDGGERGAACVDDTERSRESPLVVVDSNGYVAERGFDDLKTAKEAVEQYNEGRPEHAPHGVEDRSSTAGWSA